MALFDNCIAETGVEPHVAQMILKHDFSFIDPSGRCFVKCVCSKAGWCTADNKIVISSLEERTPIPKEKVSQVQLLIFGGKCLQRDTFYNPYIALRLVLFSTALKLM